MSELRALVVNTPLQVEIQFGMAMVAVRLAFDGTLRIEPRNSMPSSRRAVHLEAGK